LRIDVVIDLRAPHFRHLSANPARHTEWQRLSIVPERHYNETHTAARELMNAAPKATGLAWHSRQITAQTAYVLYSPPLTPPIEFEVMSTEILDQAGGWALIDEALQIVGVERLRVGPLVRKLLDELPPENPEEQYMSQLARYRVAAPEP